MRHYLRNSPEAVSRLVAMAIIADAEVDDCEIEALDCMDFYGSVGINKWAFGDVLADFCDDLMRSADRHGRIRLLARRKVDRALAEVDDARLRAQTVALIANVLKSDGKLEPQESAFLAHVLKRWNFSPAAATSARAH